MVSVGKLQSVRKACKINDKIFLELTRDFNFKTEKDLERFILKRFREEGVGIAYRPIVANNYSKIHAIPRKRKFKRGFVVLDFGSRVNGWCSDMTRTIFLGKANKRERELYELVLSCQKKCVGKVRVGRSYKGLDLFARKLLGRHKKYFTHALGHGIGRVVHTRPRIGPKSEDSVKIGEIIAIEPGIYLKTKLGEFGIRVEDTLVVKRNGAEVLSKSPKDLIEIDGF